MDCFLSENGAQRFLGRQRKQWRCLAFRDGRLRDVLINVGMRYHALFHGSRLETRVRARNLPDARRRAYGEGGHGAARPDRVIHRHLFNTVKATGLLICLK
jgi:hypothetical protein